MQNNGTLVFDYPTVFWCPFPTTGKLYISRNSVADLGEGQGGAPWLGKRVPLGPLEWVTVMWCCSNFCTIQSKSSIMSRGQSLTCRLLAVTWSDVVKPLSITTPRSARKHFKEKWRHHEGVIRSLDVIGSITNRMIANWHFPLGCPFETSSYLASSPRYLAPKIIRLWRLQWRHKARINYSWGSYRNTLQRNIGMTTIPRGQIKVKLHFLRK